MSEDAEIIPLGSPKKHDFKQGEEVAIKGQGGRYRIEAIMWDIPCDYALLSFWNGEAWEDHAEMLSSWVPISELNHLTIDKED